MNIINLNPNALSHSNFYKKLNKNDQVGMALPCVGNNNVTTKGQKIPDLFKMKSSKYIKIQEWVRL